MFWLWERWSFCLRDWFLSQLSWGADKTCNALDTWGFWKELDSYGSYRESGILQTPERKRLKFWKRVFKMSPIGNLHAQDLKKTHQQKRFERPPESLARVCEGLSFMKPVHKDRERWLVFWVCWLQHKVTSHMKKQGNMAQSKEQNKSTETFSKEIEVYELIDKEFKIMIIKMPLSTGKWCMYKMVITIER